MRFYTTSQRIIPEHSYRSAADSRPGCRDGSANASQTDGSPHAGNSCRHANGRAGFRRSRFHPVRVGGLDVRPAPAAPPLDTTPGAVVAPVAPPPPPTPAGCKTSGGWLQINNDIIRVPANTLSSSPTRTRRGKKFLKTIQAP